MKNRNQQTCIEPEDIELYLLHEKNYEREPLISKHIDSCYDCYMQYFELRTFHVILNKELSKPISRQIKEMVKGIQNNN